MLAKTHLTHGPLRLATGAGLDHNTALFRSASRNAEPPVFIQGALWDAGQSSASSQTAR